MNAMRNYIAHEYEKINFSVVWETIRDDLPEQIAQIDALLSQ